MKSTKITYLFEFPKFRKQIKKLNDIIFFFPFYHFGGGETVHLDILKIFEKYSTSCFVIHKSDNDFLKEEFEKVTQLIDLGKYKSLKYESYIKSLAKKINNRKNPIVFGCNNRFFYNLIGYLDDTKVKIIDLTHAFSYEDPHSVEKFSLPFVHKIHRRVILGQRTYNDYQNLYLKHGIDLNFLERIVIISNAVQIPNFFTIKPLNEGLKVLFVSRNSFEKRPEVFFEIAKRCYERKVNAFFTVIGDFENIENSYSNINIIGSINIKEELNRYYIDNDVLLITSFREGLPMVILEGMAFGTVPISTDVGEISSFVNNRNNNGILLDDSSVERYINIPHRYTKNEKWFPNNQLKNIPEDLETIIEKFIKTIKNLDENRNILNSLSENAYNTLKNNFSEEKQKKAYLDLFFS
ncbi:glycosyltransferase family 4 protein [Kaistella sp.]|uniref:glycosyltransferase family 4 protein n=1 Tax=Kaistella sp. TaxID=2782235 RepID=UPI003C4BA019